MKERSTRLNACPSKRRLKSSGARATASPYAVRNVGMLALLAVTWTAPADVRLNKGAIEIVGRLSQADVATLDTTLKGQRSETPFIVLDSLGGEVLPAMQMGRLLRARKATVFVFGPASCGSACVFLLAAGVDRIVLRDPHVGIHRPAFPPALFANLSSDAAMRLYNSLIGKCRTYLKEMGMADSLLDEMLSVPSGDVRWLTEDELARFKLAGRDPAWAEWVRAKGIKRYGLAEIEREERVLKCIETTNDFDGCVKLHGSPFPPGVLPPGFEPLK